MVGAASFCGHISKRRRNYSTSISARARRSISQRNTSGLTSAEFSYDGGFLPGIAENPEPLLFGATTPMHFATTTPP